MGSNFFTLGLYQLENLIMARPSFRFFDVRMHPQSVTDVRVQALLTQAIVVRKSELLNHLETIRVRPEEPIVLLCEDGRLSDSAASELEAAGYKQVYIV